jgi:hypothetical protein
MEQALDAEFAAGSHHPARKLGVNGGKAGFAAFVKYPEEINNGFRTGQMLEQRGIVPDIALDHLNVGKQDEMFGRLAAARQHFDAKTSGIQSMDDMATDETCAPQDANILDLHGIPIFAMSAASLAHH